MINVLHSFLKNISLEIFYYFIINVKDDCFAWMFQMTSIKLKKIISF